MTEMIDWILHLDAHLQEWMGFFGPWMYLLMFLVIFCETGLVITPFLPGDSLLFALGALCASGEVLSLPVMAFVLIVAAILGDAVNYMIGARVGPKIFNSESSRWLNKEHLIRTHAFYETYGGKTIILARFIPIIRTFAPFVAGIGKMTYSRFFFFNVTGGILWVVLFLGGGHLFGNLPAVKQNFHFVILGIIVVSCLPIVIEYIQQRRAARAKLSAL